MNIRIQAKDFPLTPAIRSEVADQVERALARFDSRIVDVDVFLSDVNGPKGGPDKVCTLRVQLPNRTTVPIETVEPDLYSAIRKSAARARRSVRRTLAKQQRLEPKAIRKFRHAEDALT